MILFFPGLIPHCPLVPLFRLKIWRGTEWIIMGPRFHTNCTVAGAAVWKERLKIVLHASGLAHIAPGLLSLHAVKRAVENLKHDIMPKICTFFFVCNEKCDTTLSFLRLFSTEKSLSAINICFWFYFTFFFFLNFYSFTVLLLNFCFFTRKSQDIAVTEIQWTFLRRQMCWWLL